MKCWPGAWPGAQRQGWEYVTAVEGLSRSPPGDTKISLPGRRIICLVGAGISTCKCRLPEHWGPQRVPGVQTGPASLIPGSLPLCLQLPASPTSALRPPVSMPTWRSTAFPTQRPSLRSATSRCVLPPPICLEWRGGVALLQPSADPEPLARSLSLSQKHPEPFFALAKELYPGQFKVSCFFFFCKRWDQGLRETADRGKRNFQADTVV